MVVVVRNLKMRNKKKWEICIAEVTFRMGVEIKPVKCL